MSKPIRERGNIHADAAHKEFLVTYVFAVTLDRHHKNCIWQKINCFCIVENCSS